MPHIEQSRRPHYDKALNKLPPIENKGDLEYCVYNLMKLFMKTRDYRYSTLHEAVYGTVHSAHEFERLYLDKREDVAIKKNGEA